MPACSSSVSASWRSALHKTRVWGTSCQESAVHCDKGPRWHKTYVFPSQPTPLFYPVLKHFGCCSLSVWCGLERRIMKGLFGSWRFFRLAWWNRENSGVGTFRIPPSRSQTWLGSTDSGYCCCWLGWSPWQTVSRVWRAEFDLSRIVCSSSVEFWVTGGRTS